MPNFGRRALALGACLAITTAVFAQPGHPDALNAPSPGLAPPPASAAPVLALPGQTSRIRLSNRDINHVTCEGGDIDDVKFSVEKGIAVEKGGADAWIKFLVHETDDAGAVTRSFVTTPSEFFVTCNGAVYPLYAEPSDIPAQTVRLVAGSAQKAQANEALLGPLVEEDRAVSITLAMLQDRVPASFAQIAPDPSLLHLATLPGTSLQERRHIAIDGAGLAASEYIVRPGAATDLDERAFLDRSLGADIFAVTLDRTHIATGGIARLIVIRRSSGR